MTQKMLMLNFNTRFRRDLSLQGNYTYNLANDLPGTPTNPYDFNLDWGRSSFERRHRLVLVGSMPDLRREVEKLFLRCSGS